MGSFMGHVFAQLLRLLYKNKPGYKKMGYRPTYTLERSTGGQSFRSQWNTSYAKQWLYVKYEIVYQLDLRFRTLGVEDYN